MLKKIKICTGKSCLNRGSEYIITRLENDKKFYNFPENIELIRTLCLWNCENPVNIMMDNEKISNQNPAKASFIFQEKMKNCNQKNIL